MLKGLLTNKRMLCWIWCAEIVCEWVLLIQYWGKVSAWQPWGKVVSSYYTGAPQARVILHCQWDLSLSGKDTSEICWNLCSLYFKCQEVLPEKAFRDSYLPLGDSFSTAHWIVFKHKSLYLLTICPGTWIGEKQERKVSSSIIFVIIRLLLCQNRYIDLNKLHTFAVLEGRGCESILMELAGRNRC